MKKILFSLILALAFCTPVFATVNMRLNPVADRLTADYTKSYYLGSPDTVDKATIGDGMDVEATPIGGTFPYLTPMTIRMTDNDTLTVYNCVTISQTSTKIVFHIPEITLVSSRLFFFDLIDTLCVPPCTVYRQAIHRVPTWNYRTFLENVTVGGVVYPMLKGSLYGYTVSPVGCIVGVNNPCTITGTEYIKSLTDGVANQITYHGLPTIMQVYTTNVTAFSGTNRVLFWQDAQGRVDTYASGTTDVRVLNVTTPYYVGTGIVIVHQLYSPYLDGFAYDDTGSINSTLRVRTWGYIYLKN